MRSWPVTSGAGRQRHGRRAADFLNHRWDDPATFVKLGEIPAHEIRELTEGRFNESVPVALNWLLVDYEHVVICGPVFPHEVVGFGGTKYLFRVAGTRNHPFDALAGAR